MESKIIEGAEKELLYPYLGIRESSISDTVVVLFASEKVGMIVFSDGKGQNLCVGDSWIWDTLEFKPFEGEVILKN